MELVAQANGEIPVVVITYDSEDGKYSYCRPFEEFLPYQGWVTYYDCKFSGSMSNYCDVFTCRND